VNKIKLAGAVTVAVVVILMSVVLTAVTAQVPVRSRKTYAFIGATPNPVGVNQEVLVHIGITDYLYIATDGWSGLTVTVEKPDGKTETLGPFRTDSTGGTGFIYVPTMVGTYYLQAHFPAQWYNWTSPVRADVLYEASDSEKLALIVVEERVPTYPSVQLPSEYWTRPINAQFREWSAISGSWLETWPYVPEDPKMRVATYSKGPEAPHILWTKPLSMPGLAGGELGGEAPGFEHGDAYEGKFLPPVIVGGILCYNRYEERGGYSIQQQVVALDVHTGEELWIRNNTRIAFAQLFYFKSYNYQGVFAYLWETVGSTWNAYDVFTGRWVYTMTGVPSGPRVRGPMGEILIYSVNTAACWMTKWNSTRVVMLGLIGADAGSWRPHGRSYNASRGIEWNVTIPQGLPGGIRAVLDDRILLSSDYRWSTEEYTIRGDYSVRFACISTKPGREGALIFNTTWVPPEQWSSAVLIASLEDGIFIVGVQEIRALLGFSLDTGQKVWGPTDPQHYLEIYTICNDRRGVCAIYNGKLYKGGMSGTLYCYDVKTGELLWTYEAEDPYNEIKWSATQWPLYWAFACDGKIYLFHSEHSANTPLPRGAPFICLDAETGKEIWSINLRGHHWGGYPVIGDSIIVMYNTYDQQIYALGMGPSSTTVTVTPEVVAKGQSVLIEGTVMDISPGINDAAIKFRFPNGVPAIADENMSAWMEYVYMQKERPTDVKGVWVTFDAISPNGEWIHVGGTTTDASGMYSIPWTPPSEGLWTIVITFPGTKSYWPSYAQTSLLVTAAPPTPETPEIPTPPDYTPILTGLAVAIIVVAILVVYDIISVRKMRK